MSDELVPIGQTDEGLPMCFNPTLSSKSDGHWSSFDETTDAGSCAAMNAMGGGALKGVDFIDKQIPVQHMLVHVVCIMDEKTGEISEAPRTVLIAHDGTAVAFCAAGIIPTLRKAVKKWGPPPWNPPLVFTPKRQSTRKGWYTTILQAHGPMVAKEEGNAAS